MGRLQIIIYPKSKEEKEVIEKKAEVLGMSISQYLIFVGLNTEIKININNKASE